ncbi:hypothetical protein NLM24_38315 [Nocardia zapadnayensis]|nr:hypothetical protein [Nocardia zapadnayensis]MCX0276412.1 hypothetical protein [Nocardia zapadnayensis]
MNSAPWSKNHDAMVSVVAPTKILSMKYSNSSSLVSRVSIVAWAKRW